MGASVFLYRGIEKIINKQNSNIDEMKDKIADLFIQSGSMLPGDLLEDLYHFYLESGTGSGNKDITDRDHLRELAYHLVDIIDLFDMDYDDEKDPLILEEWITIKDLFSSYAENIDDELLTYVMKFAIEKGAFQSS